LIHFYKRETIDARMAGCSESSKSFLYTPNCPDLQ